MLVDLYPKVHRRYSSLAIIGPILDGYGTWLLKQGYSTERPSEHFRAAPRLVRGLQQRGVQALTSLTRARLRACAPADSQEDPDLAVLVRQMARYCESKLSLYPPPALTRVEQRVAAYRSYLQQVRGFAPSTLRHHGRTAGEFLAHMDYETHPTRLAALDRRDLDTFLVCRRRPPVACVPPACGGRPPSLPPVPGVCRRGSDRARHADRHAPRLSRRAAPTGAALGHGSGVPPHDRPHDPAGPPRPHDLSPHGHLRPAHVRGRDAQARRCGVAGGAAAHPATQDTRLAPAAAHRRGRDRARRPRRPEREGMDLRNRRIRRARSPCLPDLLPGHRSCWKVSANSRRRTASVVSSHCFRWVPQTLRCCCGAENVGQ